MSNALFPKFLEYILALLTSNDVKAVLVDTNDYTYDGSTDEFLSDIPSGARVATSGNLSSKTVTLGAFSAANSIFPAVSGDQSEAVVLYIDTGSEATSRLIAYIDTMGGLPVTPNGMDIEINWDTGDNKIFHL